MRTRPTLSFFILVAITATISYTALIMTKQVEPHPDNIINGSLQTASSPATTAQAPSTTPNADISTSDWVEFVDNTHYLSFKHPDNWQVQTFPNRSGFYIISIDPDKGNDKFRIYVSPENYFGFAGLPTKQSTIAGLKASSINDMSYGVKYSAQYYTFDMGTDLSLQPEFQAFINTIAFSK